jgi:hypothetical protein
MGKNAKAKEFDFTARLEARLERTWGSGRQGRRRPPSLKPEISITNRGAELERYGLVT